MKRIFPSRSWQRAVMVAAVLTLAGCADVPQAQPKPVPATDVGRLDAWRDAEQITSRDTERVTVIGAGASMRPIYGENTVLVLSKIDYADLQAGMQVGYVNSAGRRVVHVLVEPDNRGWMIKGLNNEAVDRERVTRYNLIGVVYASFATDDALR